MFTRARVAVVVVCLVSAVSVSAAVAGPSPHQECGTTVPMLEQDLRATRPDPATILAEPSARSRARAVGRAVPGAPVVAVDRTLPALPVVAVVAVERTVPAVPAVPAPPSGVSPASPAAPAQATATWEEVDKVTARVRIPAGDRYVVRFDHLSRRLVEVRPEDTLTDVGRQAVDRAPDWLADALSDKLARMSAPVQSTFAQLILDAEDPIVDEVAFQVARVGIGSLTDARFKPSLLVDNARAMYEHDALLDYVEIVDQGSAAAGGDYRSTTRYRVGAPDDPSATTWIEVPSEIYYWYVVHPRLSDETVKASLESDERQATYGHFWRRYLFENPDTVYDYARNFDGGPPYPVLGTVLQQAKILWDGKAVDLPGERPFGPDDTALDVVGHWVSSILPDKASGNRPVQPNQIAFEHNGNCGEIQDLLGAASRTALIPNVLTSNHCEDHVWNEVHVGAPTLDWHAYQVDWDGGPTRISNFGVAYDKDRGGSKDVSGIWAWRSDGFAFDIVDHYSLAADLVVRVETAAGKPVDGARVVLYSEAWSGEGFVPATFGFTDANGTSHFRLGDHQNYYVRVTSTLGNFPTAANTVTGIIEDSVAGHSYAYTAKLAGTLRRYADQVQMRPDEGYKIAVRFAATDEILYGSSPFGEGADFADWRRPGQIDFVAFDNANFAYYDDGRAGMADALSENAASGEMTVAAGKGDIDEWAVFSNEDHAVNAQMVEVEVTLLRNPAVAPMPAYLPAVRNR